MGTMDYFSRKPYAVAVASESDTYYLSIPFDFTFSDSNQFNFTFTDVNQFSFTFTKEE